MSSEPELFNVTPSTQIDILYRTPVIDGDLLRDYPLRLFQQGKFVKVPPITGGGESPVSLLSFPENKADKTSSDK